MKSRGYIGTREINKKFTQKSLAYVPPIHNLIKLSK
jgi:hypothetical protein